MSLKQRFYVKAHIPRGSGDSDWHIVTDTGAVIALVDPMMQFDEPDKLADMIVEAMNASEAIII